METLNEVANWVGFGSFEGMFLYFLFLTVTSLAGIVLYYGNKTWKHTKETANSDLGSLNGSCECGEHKECVRKIHSNRGGKLRVENEEHFKCGKVKKQVESMLDWWNNHR